MNSSPFQWLLVPAAMLALAISPLHGQDTSEESGAKQKKEIVQVEAKVVDGKVIVTDDNGDVRILKIIRSGDGKFDVTVDEGKPHMKVTGKAILVGPDGTHEVILDEAHGNEVMWSGELKGIGPGPLALKWQPGQEAEDVLVQLSALGASNWRIGVSCDTAGDALKAQLGLENGLVVDSVVDDSPATGQIEAHDILLRAGETQLNELSDLVEAVQHAGENDESLEIQLVRGGKKMTVNVTPAKREDAGMLLQSTVEPKLVEGLLKQGPHKLSDGVLLESIGPGFIRAKTESDELKVQIEQLREEIRQLREEIDN